MPDAGAPYEPFGGRTPTSHERQAGVPWDASYVGRPPPWDLGRPQPAVVRMAAGRNLAGPVLDAGCGTGHNALHLASLGLPVLGVDVAATAVAEASAEARRRGLDARFEVADALALERLTERFATVLDCGLFHALDGDERRRYVAGLASVTEPGARVYVLCFRDAEGPVGPHPVSAADLQACFEPRAGWELAALEHETVETRFAPDGLPGWLAVAIRRPPPLG